MELRVLGPLDLVAGGGEPVAPRAPKQRRLLAALAVAHGRAQSPDALIDAVWGASPPASARKLLQVYTSQLRKTLGDGVEIVTAPGGYALEVAGESLDAVRFEHLLAEGRRALRDGSPGRADSLL